MTFDDLTWEAKGCCGEYQVAAVPVSDGVMHLTKTEGGARVVVIRDGMMVRDMGELTEAECAALLP